MKWFEQLMAKVAETEPHVPTSEIKPYERVIGTAPEELQRLMGYMIKFQTENIQTFNAQMSEHMKTHLDPAHGKAECTGFAEEMVKNMAQKKEEADLMEQLFWQELRVAVNLPTGNIGYRQNWQITTWDPKDDHEEQLRRIISIELVSASPLSELLRHLRG